MKPSVSPGRARTIIQSWYKDFCEFYGKPARTLDVQEEDEKVSRAYKVTNTQTGSSTVIFWSMVSDYESSGSMEIPGDLKGSIWDAFQDLV